MSVDNKIMLVACIVFVALISIPMMVSVVQPDKKISESEKRTLQVWPVYAESKSLQSYFASINAYFNDHFGFRDELIELNNQIKYSLNESPVKRVIRGNDDWLFLKFHDPLMSSTAVQKEITKVDTIARIKYVEATHKQLSQKNIAYQYIVIPNKMSVYPEHLPAKYALTDINATFDFYKSKINNADGSIGFNAIDILVENKRNEYEANVYFKNDSHWNDLGAYFVYQESLRRLKQIYPHVDLALKPHLFELRRKYSGDLAYMTGLKNRLMALEPRTSFAPCTARSSIIVVKENVSKSSCNTNATTMLLIGDSFMSGIYAYMSESVGTLYMSDQKASRAQLQETIDELQPDVVIEILVERSLVVPLH